MEIYLIEEASHICDVPVEEILLFIREEWVLPPVRDRSLLDQEDVARIRLIWELKTQFGVNDDSMPIILNLLDQLYRTHLELMKSRVH